MCLKSYWFCCPFVGFKLHCLLHNRKRATHSAYLLWSILGAQCMHFYVWSTFVMNEFLRFLLPSPVEAICSEHVSLCVYDVLLKFLSAARNHGPC